MNPLTGSLLGVLVLVVAFLFIAAYRLQGELDSLTAMKGLEAANVRGGRFLHLTIKNPNAQTAKNCFVEWLEYRGTAPPVGQHLEPLHRFPRSTKSGGGYQFDITGGGEARLDLAFLQTRQGVFEVVTSTAANYDPEDGIDATRRLLFQHRQPAPQDHFYVPRQARKSELLLTDDTEQPAGAWEWRLRLGSEGEGIVPLTEVVVLVEWDGQGEIGGKILTQGSVESLESAS